MRARLLLVAALAGSALMPALDGGQKAAAPIPVHVTVKVSDGQVNTSLTREAFQVRSDDVPVPIESFEIARVPASIIVLFDLTASVDLGPSADREMLAAFEAGFIARLEDGDRVGIGGISSVPFISPGFSSGKNDIRRSAAEAFSVPAAHRYGPSPIWDAIDAAVAVLEKEPGRRVIIAHTDGISTGDKVRRQDAVVRAAAANVALMIIAPTGLRADANLRGAAHSTGGTFLLGFGPPLRDRAVPRLVEAFEQVLTDVRSAYTLTVTPPVADGNLHRLDVRVAGRFHAVLARQLYRAEK